MIGADSDLQKVIPPGATTYQGDRVRGPQVVNADGTLQPVSADGKPRLEGNALFEHLADNRFTPAQKLVADVLDIDLSDLYDEDGSPMESEPDVMARVNRMVALVESGKTISDEELHAVELYDHVNGLLSLQLGRFPEDSPVHEILATDLGLATTELNTALDGLIAAELNAAPAQAAQPSSVAA